MGPSELGSKGFRRHLCLKQKTQPGVLGSTNRKHSDVKLIFPQTVTHQIILFLSSNENVVHI